MQQLEETELWKVPREPPPSEEPMRDVDEGTPSPESPEKVDGPAELSPEGRSEAKSVLESTPALPQRPTNVNAGENLPNGELQGGHPFGNECSPQEAKAQVIPVAAEEGGHRPHQGGPEAVSAADPAGQSPDPGKAPAGRQRKLAMEEIVIRDHLGQEVGCMDAVGQNQSSLEKEEELGDHTDHGPVDGVLDANEAPGEGPLDQELGSRAGPEGESPTSRDPQNESGYPKGQGDGPPEVGSAAREVGASGAGQKVVPEQSANEVAPALALAAGDAPTTESVGQGQGGQMKTPEGQESGATEEERPGPHRPGPPRLERLTASPPHPFPPVPEMKDPSSQEEAEAPPRDPALPSSPAQILLTPQGTVPSLQGTEESPLDQTPFQGNEASLPGPERSSVPNQGPSPPLDQNPSLPESGGSLLDQTSSAGQGRLPDENPPSRRDPLSPPLAMKPPGSQGEAPPRPDMEDQVTSSLREAEGALLSWSQTLSGTQTTSPLDQPAAPLPGGEPLALQPLPPAGPGTEKPATQQGQELLRHEAEGSLPDTIHSSTDQPPSLPDQEVSLPDAPTAASGESLAAPRGQAPAPEPRVSSLPEAEVFLPGPIPPPVDDPCEKPLPHLDQVPPALHSTEAASLMGDTPASSLQEAVDGALPDAIQAPLPSHASPDLPEEEGSCPDQGPPAPGGQTTTSLLGQAPSSQGAAESLPEGEKAPGPPGGSANSAEHASSPDKGQSPGLQDTPACPNALPLSSPGTLPPLPEKSQAAEEGQDAKGRGRALAGAGEVAEVLGDLHAETQPLLKEAQATGDLAAAGDLPSKAGILKPQVATSNHTPNDSGSRSSANTAYAHLPRQDQEPEKGKRKSCQCCVLM